MRALGGLQRTAKKLPPPFCDVMTGFIESLFDQLAAKDAEIARLNKNLEMAELALAGRTREHDKHLDDKLNLKDRIARLEAALIHIRDYSTFPQNEAAQFLQGLAANALASKAADNE